MLLSASAVGYYGDTGDRVVDESAPRGAGFLAELCGEWEAATRPAEEAGIRVAHLRTGLVLSADGGLLKRLRPIVSLGVAGRLGSGRQYLPWISLADEIAAIRFLLEHEVSGPVNLTGPDPVRNAEFIATLARLVHRPAIVPTPGIRAADRARRIRTGHPHRAARRPGQAAGGRLHAPARRPGVGPAVGARALISA